MGSIRELGNVDQSLQLCGHVGDHEAVRDRFGVVVGYLGYKPSGEGVRCDHFVWRSRSYKQRRFETVERWRVECACGADLDDWSQVAAEAVWRSHVDVQTRLLQEYLPADEPPWKDAT